MRAVLALVFVTAIIAISIGGTGCDDGHHLRHGRHHGDIDDDGYAPSGGEDDDAGSSTTTDPDAGARVPADPTVGVDAADAGDEAPDAADAADDGA